MDFVAINTFDASGDFSIKMPPDLTIPVMFYRVATT